MACHLKSKQYMLSTNVVSFIVVTPDFGSYFFFVLFFWGGGRGVKGGTGTRLWL